MDPDYETLHGLVVVQQDPKLFENRKLVCTKTNAQVEPNQMLYLLIANFVKKTSQVPKYQVLGTSLSDHKQIVSSAVIVGGELSGVTKEGGTVMDNSEKTNVYQNFPSASPDSVEETMHRNMEFNDLSVERQMKLHLMLHNHHAMWSGQLWQINTV